MKYILVIIVSVASFFIYSCKKTTFTERPLSPGLPVVITAAISAITNDNALTGGTVISEGDSSVTERGVVWSIDSLPTVGLSTKTLNGSDTGNYISHITGLNCLTNYYVRAYATNALGTSYGNVVRFTTTWPTNTQQLNLYKSHSTDTLLMRRTIVGNSLRVQVNHYILSELQLPQGIYLYVKFDSVYHNILCGNGLFPNRNVNAGDTIHLNPAFGAGLGISAEPWYTGMGDIYYDSKCTYSIYLAGRANTAEDTYRCKFYNHGDMTNTTSTTRFVNDTTCNSTCNFQ